MFPMCVKIKSREERFATYNVGKSTKSKLANDGSRAGGQLDGSIRVGGHLARAGVVDYTQHGGQERHGEDVVGIRKETNAGHEDRPHVVPAERRLVDLGQGKATTLVGVLDVSLVGAQVSFLSARWNKR